jgi:hypothetical protein
MKRDEDPYTPFVLAVFLFVPGGGVLLWECWQWIHTAEWPGLTVRDGMPWLFMRFHHAPTDEVITPYLGLNVIIREVLGFSLPGTLLVLAGGLAVLVALIELAARSKR